MLIPKGNIYLQYYLLSLGLFVFFSVSGRKKWKNVYQFKISFLGHPSFSDHKFSLDDALFSDTERRRTSLLILYCSSYCWTSEDFGLCSIGLQRQQYVSNFAPSNFPNQYAVLQWQLQSSHVSTGIQQSISLLA